MFLLVNGRVEKNDYEGFVPEIEKQIHNHDKINLLVDVRGLESLSAGAAFEDTKFGIKHYNHFRKVAIIGNNNWEKFMAYVLKPLTTAKVRYYEEDEYDEAMEWVRADELVMQ